jgi:hypothetical protein
LMGSFISFSLELPVDAGDDECRKFDLVGRIARSLKLCRKEINCIGWVEVR